LSKRVFGLVCALLGSATVGKVVHDLAHQLVDDLVAVLEIVMQDAR
jgi:mannose/cellobiose epimerase-like protein (N-acyl-D-glucosamine 2-epimerase family)